MTELWAVFFSLYFSMVEIDAIDKNTDLARLKITYTIEMYNLFCENNVTTKAKEFSIILD